MKKNTTIKYFLMLFIFCSTIINAQNNIELIQPRPKQIENSETVSRPIAEVKVVAYNDPEKKAAQYFCSLIDTQRLEMQEQNENDYKNIQFVLDKETHKYKNNQHYTITSTENTIIVKSPSTLGLQFGASTLSSLIKVRDDCLNLHLCNISDWPLFTRRIFSFVPNVDNVEEVLAFALKNKFETVAIASRIFPWYKITDEYLLILKKIKTWKDKFGGPNIMQMINIYEEQEIIISKDEDIDRLKNVIKVSHDSGITKTMICADDTPPFIYGDGYVLTDENDLKKFSHMAEAHVYLLNELVAWSKRNSIVNEFYYVPPFYTYEDMHYGEMELYKDTPWEEKAFAPLKRDLKYLGNNLNNEVFVIWTGPFVRSRKITTSDLTDWTNNLNGMVPFLWDNTLYSHHPFSSSPMFTAWNNDFPKEFYKQTAGNGIFINGDLSSEDTKAAAITVNDYLWNPKDYDPVNAINTALQNVYGTELSKYILDYKDCELNIRRTIGERELWFEADTLWASIRKAKSITTKNPFYYHYNYSRMKALRLQLKNSVPAAADKKKFEKTCIELENRRKNIINKVAEINQELSLKLKQISVPLPDFEN